MKSKTQSDPRAQGNRREGTEQNSEERGERERGRRRRESASMAVLRTYAAMRVRLLCVRPGAVMNDDIIIIIVNDDVNAIYANVNLIKGMPISLFTALLTSQFIYKLI